jgi:hypothetical protein
MLDGLTTIVFLLAGVQEANPVVRMAISLAPNPFAGLAAVKAAAMCLGIYCAWRGKHVLLQRINILFAVVVTWNLVALIFGVMKLV